MGSRIGWPPSSSTSKSLPGPPWRWSAAKVITSPGPNTVSWPVWTGLRSAPPVPDPPTPSRGAGRDGGVEEGDGCVRDARATEARQVPGDEPEQRAAVGRGQQPDLAGPDVLVPGVGNLESAGQVHPELDPVEQPAAHDQFLRGLLYVQNAAASGHPLR